MNSSEKRVLVTGATGLIGRQLEKPLHDAGFDIYAITIDRDNTDNGIHWLKGNLFDENFVRKSMESVRPTHMLNMAWATTGDYLSSDINYRFLQAGVSLARAFAENGGRRAIYAGTCFEYKFKGVPLSETDDLEPDKYTYTFCKDALRQIVSRYFAAHDISFGYGRVFYVFGPGESITRLTGMVMDKLTKGQKVVIKSGQSIKDYMYSKDIANAFVSLLCSDVNGCVNICTGRGIKIRDYVLEIANRLAKGSDVEFVDDHEICSLPVVGNNKRLKDEVGYIPRWSLKSALDDLIEE